MSKALVYIAAPLFSVAEMDFNRRLRDALTPVVDVFLPQEDGGLVTDLVASGATINEAAAAVFQMDLAAITRCDALIIVMDGRAIDEGASVELGIAYALGKVCVGLQTDVRRLIQGRNNPMVECSVDAVLTSETDVVAWIGRRFNTGRSADDSAALHEGKCPVRRPEVR